MSEPPPGTGTNRSCKDGSAAADGSQLQANFDRINALYQVSTVIHSTLEPHQALELLVQEAVRLMRANSGSVILINPTSGFLEIQVAQGLPPNVSQLKLRVGEGITGWVARFGKAARVGEVRADPRYIMVRPEIRSELAVPLEVNGEIRGVLNVDSDQADAFSAADQELLEAFAGQATRVIENTWRYEQLRLKAGLFESLIRVSQIINSTLSLADTLQVITREAVTLMEAQVSSLLMLDPTGDWLELCASSGAGPDYINKPPLSVSESFLGAVIRRKKPLQLENVQVSSRYQSVEIARREGLISLLSVPLIFQGQATGALNVYKAQPHSFSNEEIRILSALADLSAIAIAKARWYERIVEAEAQLRETEKLSALGLLAAEVAHEIRNPLTVMKMLYHSLDLNFSAEDPRSRDAQMIVDKMDHLNRVVEQILGFARHAEPEMAGLNVNDLIEDVMLLVRYKLHQHQIELDCALARDTQMVRGDRVQLEQALLNLVLNAIEAMPGGGRLRLTTRNQGDSPETAPGFVAIEIADTGEGMSEEQQTRAFTALLGTSKPKGTGLGLRIVAKIIEVHQGTITLTSQVGKGTRFVILLPGMTGP